MQNERPIGRFLLERHADDIRLSDTYAIAEDFSAEYKDLLGKSSKGAVTVADIPLKGATPAKLEFDASHPGVYVWQIDDGNERFDLIAGDSGYVFATRYLLNRQGAVMRRETIHDISALHTLQSAVVQAITTTEFLDKINEMRCHVTTLREEYSRAMGERILRNPDWEKTALFRKADEADDVASRLGSAGFEAGSRSKRTIRPLMYAEDWRPAIPYDVPKYE